MRNVGVDVRGKIMQNKENKQAEIKCENINYAATVKRTIKKKIKRRKGGKDENTICTCLVERAL
jgi:hypothetical protein